MGVQLDFNNAIHFYAIGNNSVYNPWRSQLPTGFMPKATDPLSWWEVTVGVGGGVLPDIGEFQDPPTLPDFVDPFVHFSGNFRTTNQTSGGFTIRELSFDSSRSQILSFALDFVVLEENDITKRDIGFIRFNSDIAIPAVPEPSVAALLSIGLAASIFVRRRQASQKALA